MIITDEIKAVFEGSAFIPIITMNEDNTPHPIIVGGGKVEGDTIAFDIYIMAVTRENLEERPEMWVMASTADGAPKGFRLSGKAHVEGGQVIFEAEDAEGMI